MLWHQLVISEIDAFKGSSFYPLPTEQSNSRNRLINIQNDDDGEEDDDDDLDQEEQIYFILKV